VAELTIEAGAEIGVHSPKEEEGCDGLESAFFPAAFTGGAGAGAGTGV